tara:strand:+ start:13 stop:609 length:597 start_codon:yes stop_codon:yes gene_type:complete
LKIKINIYSNKNIRFFLKELLLEYELVFLEFNEIEKNLNNTKVNIIFLNEISNTNSINFRNLNDSCFILSNLKNRNFNFNNKFIKIPCSINLLKTSIENFIENFKVQFHDIAIVNEKLTNVKNNLSCLLTKLEAEIISHIIIEKETTKDYVKENILNIKRSIQTNSLDSHLTRIRKKMNQIKTTTKIQSKNEKLSISI